MIKIIKEGNKKVIDCKNCNAVLEYQKEDEISIQTGMNEYRRYINCPCCEDEIYL